MRAVHALRRYFFLYLKGIDVLEQARYMPATTWQAEVGQNSKPAVSS